MKNLLIGLFSFLSLTLNAQNMTAKDVVTQLFVATDQQQWDKLEEVFAQDVMLDYSSMNGQAGSHISAKDIIASWKTILPGFEYTHHQLGNFLSTTKGDKATVFCYGTASHYLPDVGGNLWIVVGSYDFELVKSTQGDWQITSMIFHFKYQDGNTNLPAKAIAKVNGDPIDESQDIASRNKELVKHFFQLLEQEDIPAFVDLFAEEGKQVNPYSSGLFPTGADGKKALSAYWTPVPANFDGMEFAIEEIYAMEDPSMVYVKYTGKIKLKNDAGWYENNYYSTFRFNEDGKILEYVEIFNPIVAARGFGLLDQIK